MAFLWEQKTKYPDGRPAVSHVGGQSHAAGSLGRVFSMARAAAMAAAREIIPELTAAVARDGEQALYQFHWK